MASKAELKARVKRLFVGFPSDETTLQREARNFDSTNNQKRFSAFDIDDQDRQAELLLTVMTEFGNRDNADDGLEAALDVLETASANGEAMLAQHVMGIFAAHAPKIRPDTTSVPIPPLVFSEPITDTPTSHRSTLGGDSTPLSGEALLHWFREDIHLNEHHRHWHMVYATSGVPTGVPSSPNFPFPVRMKQRQGEVFVYMHKQMLARYDSERVAAGLSTTIPYDIFSESLGDGYSPDEREPINLGYAARPDNVHIELPNKLT